MLNFKHKIKQCLLKKKYFMILFCYLKNTRFKSFIKKFKVTLIATKFTTTHIEWGYFLSNRIAIVNCHNISAVIKDYNGILRELPINETPHFLISRSIINNLLPSSSSLMLYSQHSGNGYLEHAEIINHFRDMINYVRNSIDMDDLIISLDFNKTYSKLVIIDGLHRAAILSALDKTMLKCRLVCFTG